MAVLLIILIIVVINVSDKNRAQKAKKSEERKREEGERIKNLFSLEGADPLWIYEIKQKGLNCTYQNAHYSDAAVITAAKRYENNPRAIEIAKDLSSDFMNAASSLSKHIDCREVSSSMFASLSATPSGIDSHFKVSKSVPDEIKDTITKNKGYINFREDNIEPLSIEECMGFILAVGIYAEIIIRFNLKNELAQPNHELSVSYHEVLKGLIYHAGFIYTVPNLDYQPPKKL